LSTFFIIDKQFQINTNSDREKEKETDRASAMGEYMAVKLFLQPRAKVAGWPPH
jgi:hypothetical protein